MGEEGGFSKGGFCGIQCHAQANKNYPRILDTAVHLHSQHHSQERRAFLQKPPSKDPLVLVPEVGKNWPKQEVLVSQLRY